MYQFHHLHRLGTIDLNGGKTLTATVLKAAGLLPLATLQILIISIALKRLAVTLYLPKVVLVKDSCDTKVSPLGCQEHTSKDSGYIVNGCKSSKSIFCIFQLF